MKKLKAYSLLFFFGSLLGWHRYYCKRSNWWQPPAVFFSGMLAFWIFPVLAIPTAGTVAMWGFIFYDMVTMSNWPFLQATTAAADK